jgi:Ca2+-transporting ATPase
MGSDNQRHHLSTPKSEDPTLISTPNPSTLAYEKGTHVKIDLRDNLNPHNDPSNPFAFSIEQLQALMDPKNVPLLRSFGGLEGVARGLHVDLKAGLSTNSPAHPRITLNEIIDEKDDAVYVEELEFKRTPTVHSLARQYTHRTNVTVQDVDAFPQRRSVFGRNVLPETLSKSIWKLMWIAFQDKTLVNIAKKKK